MKKVVINGCYGGFSLSPKALLWMYDRGYTEHASTVESYYGLDGKSGPKKDAQRIRETKEKMKEDLEKWDNFLTKGKGKRDSLFLTVFTPDHKFVLYAGREIPRDHPLLVECVETLKEDSFGACAKLEIVEIPDGVEWEVSEYDGNEHIAEVHRTWR